MKCRHETPCSKRCLLGTGEIEPCRGYDKCKDFQPNYTTNGDRYRAMSDEEMAEALSKVDVCPPGAERLFCGDEDGCKWCWRDHLREPVEEV